MIAFAGYLRSSLTPGAALLVAEGVGLIERNWRERGGEMPGFWMDGGMFTRRRLRSRALSGLNEAVGADHRSRKLRLTDVSGKCKCLLDCPHRSL